MDDNNLQTQAYASDEIDLRDLVLILVEGWYWIVGAVVAAALGAFAYVSIVTPTYETQFRAVPAPVSNFSGFNLLNGFSISPEDAYRSFGNRLSSFQNFESFYQNNQDRFVLNEGAELSRLFASRFSVSGLDTAAGDRLTLTADYTYPEGEVGSELLNAYIEETAGEVWEDLRSQFHEYNRAQIARLETDLALQKEDLQQAREDRLFVLDQAIAVARRLDIEKPTTPQQFGRQPSGTEVFYASISGDGSLPLYFMGFQTLEAERDTLKEALDKGLSNGTIRDTEQMLKRHTRIAELLDEQALSGVDQGIAQANAERVLQVVEYAFEPANRSSPRKGLTMVLAVISGGMFGVFLAFLVRFGANVRAYRKRQQVS